MSNRPLYPMALFLANDARDREIRAAAQTRLIQRPTSQSVHQSISRYIVKFGARLAGEPSLELARFR